MFTEQELRKTLNLLVQVLDSLPDAFVVTDTRGIIRHFNRRVCEVTGFPAEELRGRFAYEVFYPAGKDEARKIMKKVHAAGGIVDSYETEIKCRHGETLPVILSVSLFTMGEDETLGSIGIIKDITLQKKLLRSLEEASREDSLTGCRNRRFLYEFLDIKMKEALQMGKPLSLVMIDLDRFKDINDTRGHLAGDEILKEVGSLLKEGVRDGDEVCRFGGDEFCLVMPGLRKRDAAAVAERLRRRLAAVSLGKGAARLTMSMGVATFPDNAADRDQLMIFADRACYAAKKVGGGNRVCQQMV